MMVMSIIGLCTGHQCRNKSDGELAVHLVDIPNNGLKLWLV